MNGKKIIAIIVIISVLAAIITWIYGQKMIDDLDLERSLNSTTIITNTLLSYIPIR